jgi:hypothetical protein
MGRKTLSVRVLQEMAVQGITIYVCGLRFFPAGSCYLSIKAAAYYYSCTGVKDYTEARAELGIKVSVNMRKLLVHLMKGVIINVIKKKTAESLEDEYAQGGTVHSEDKWVVFSSTR